MERHRSSRQRSYPNRPFIAPQSQALRLLATAADVVEQSGRIDVSQLLSAYQRYRTIVELSSRSNTTRPIHREVTDLTSSEFLPSTAQAAGFSEIIDLTSPTVPSSSTRAFSAARREPSGIRSSPEGIELPPVPSSQARTVRLAPACIPLKHRRQEMNYFEGVDDMCGICHEKFPDGFCLPCQHLSAHYDCLISWLQYKTSCILCREHIKQVYQVRRT